MNRRWWMKGYWPARWLCWLAGGHQFQRSHGFTNYLFCARCKKAARVKGGQDPIEAARRARQRIVDGARRMGFDVPKVAA